MRSVFCDACSTKDIVAVLRFFASVCLVFRANTCIVRNIVVSLFVLL